MNGEPTPDCGQVGLSLAADTGTARDPISGSARATRVFNQCWPRIAAVRRQPKRDFQDVALSPDPPALPADGDP